LLFIRTYATGNSSPSPRPRPRPCPCRKFLQKQLSVRPAVDEVHMLSTQHLHFVHADTLFHP